MDKVIYNLVFNKKKKLNTAGRALVQVEAYLNKKKKYFSTKVYLTPEQWDPKRQLVKKHPNADGLNHMLCEYVSSIERKELDLWLKGKAVTLDMLKDVLNAKEEDGSFLVFYYKEVMESSLKESSRKNHLTTLSLLKKFKKDISFSELTFEFITSFEQFLAQNGYHTNTIAKHMKHLKRHINSAINKEYIDYQKYAFRKYKIKSVESKHTHLSPEELSAIENLKLSGRYLKYQKTLDAFRFCCYAGLRYSDFISLKAENIVVIEGLLWLIYKSVKTSTEIRLPLYLLFGGKGVDILEKYIASGDLENFFTIKDNSTINKELMRIAKLAKIPKRISFHTARHTNATLLLYEGVNITTVQKLLGHKSVRTTQVYANIMDMTVVRDLEKMSLKGAYR